MLAVPVFRSSPGPAICLATIALLLCAVLICGCEKSSQPAEQSAIHYQVRGLIRGLPPDHNTIEVEHEDIPGFMPSMTMPFEVRDEKEIAGLGLGNAISFRLNVKERDSWIDRIEKIDPTQLQLPTPRLAATPRTQTEPRLREGEEIPDFKLIDQDGKPVTPETFRGHPFVLTFIFTRCPIPNFCPRMSSNFAELQKMIESSSAPLAGARLLSISFDPEHDSPELLKQYGQQTGADFGIWTFATGEPAEIQRLTKKFAVLVQPESGTISHSLTTALIDREGKIAKIWRGNAWTPVEVKQALDAYQ